LLRALGKGTKEFAGSLPHDGLSKSFSQWTTTKKVSSLLQRVRSLIPPKMPKEWLVEP
jgi:hypothetical protein